MTPKEDDLRSRILEHLTARPGNTLVPAAWHGYIAGLAEWGVIDLNTYARLLNLLPEQGKDEIEEITIGFNHDEDPNSCENVLEE